jgi:glycerophosphoryl diester phosphodiesterase
MTQTTSSRRGLRPLSCWRGFVGGVIFFAGMNLGLAGDAPAPAEVLVSSPRPLVIGHRGYSAVAPENTLPSFKLALTAGADLVELDYYHTRDGIPIVIHDSTLDRTTDAVARWGGSNIVVTTKTAAELQQLDAGRWFGPAYAGTRLPLLSEALELIESRGVTLIERKGGEAATLVRLLRGRQWVNRVVVQSFQWDYLKDFHQQEPRQILGALGPPSKRGTKTLTTLEKTLNPAWVDEALETGARVVVWNRAVSREGIRHAHERGAKVWVYTIDEPAVAAALVEEGVDGIISNNPALIWRGLALRGQLSGGGH